MIHRNRFMSCVLVAAVGALAVAGPAAASGDGTTASAAAFDTRPVDTSKPDRYIGNGTPRSCNSKRVVTAVAKGGVIRFRCGKKPITIKMWKTAKVRNDHPPVVLDGRGKVTLSGMGKRRILYMNTCDEAQKWTTPMCNDQDHPRLVVQNLTFVDGNSTGETDPDGGGERGDHCGRLRV